MCNLSLPLLAEESWRLATKRGRGAKSAEMRCLNQLKQVVQSRHTIYRQDWQSGSSILHYMYTHQIHVLLCRIFIYWLFCTLRIVCVCMYVQFQSSHDQLWNIFWPLPTSLGYLSSLGTGVVVASSLVPGSGLGMRLHPFLPHIVTSIHMIHVW